MVLMGTGFKIHRNDTVRVISTVEVQFLLRRIAISRPVIRAALSSGYFYIETRIQRLPVQPTK